MAGRQIRRGTAAQRIALGGLSVGEFGFETDTKDVYIGAAGGDQLVSDASAWAHLGGQDQAVKTTSLPEFPGLGLGSVQVRSQAIALIDEAANPVLDPLMFETSRIMDGAQCDLWTDDSASDHPKLYYTYATDNTLNTFAALTEVLDGIRYPTVILEGGVYYLFASKWDDANIHLWQSTDKTTWTIMNGGAPVFTTSADPTSIYSHNWNCGVIVLDGVWHFFIECGTQGDQSDVGIGYSYSTLAEMNWDTHRVAAQIIPYGLNPNPIAVPNRDAVLMFHGELHYSQAGITDITAHYADVDDDFALSATWKRAPFFCIHYDDAHIADPDIVVAGPTKDHNIIFGYNWNQYSQYQKYSDLTLDEFFDAATVYDAANFENRNFLNLYSLDEDGNPGMYAAGAEANIDLHFGGKGTGFARCRQLRVTPITNCTNVFEVTNALGQQEFVIDSVNGRGGVNMYSFGAPSVPWEIGVNAVASTIVTGLKLTQGNPGGSGQGTAIELSTGLWPLLNPKIAGFFDGVGQCLAFFTSTSPELSEKMRIDSAGQVGIGVSTALPALSKLSIMISGENGLTLRDASDTAAQFLYSTVTGENRIGGKAAYAFPTIYSGGAERVRVLTTGQVGINKTDPTTNLAVVGLPSYANNAAAVAAGKTTGDFYCETGTDPLRVCVVA